MNRQTRRRIAVAISGALAGATSPLWGPALLSGIPAFQVRYVEVEGVQFTAGLDLRAVAGIDSTCSIWDDPAAWESALRAHPLVEEATVRRAGTRTLRIEVREVQASALVPTPGLVVIDSDGHRLDVDPAEYGLDLPILDGATLDSVTGRVREEGARRSLAVLAELSALSPGFVRQVSEIRPLDSEAFALRLMDDSPVEWLTLPFRDAARAFLQASAAIRAARERGPVQSVDARFASKVFVRTGVAP